MKRSALLVFVIAVTSICSGQWLERQVVIGDTLGGISLTGGIVVNPISGNVYIESSPIQVFSPVTMEKIRGPGSTGLVIFCPPSGKGYVLRDSAVILDAAADTVLSVTALPFRPSSLAYSPASDRLYLGSTSSETLFVFDPDGDSVLTAVGIGADVSALLWDSAWNRLYVGTQSNSLSVVDCTADTLLASVPVGNDDVSKLALSTVSHKLYCVAGDTGLTIVSTDSLKVIGVTPALELDELLALVYNPFTDRLACLVTDSLCVIDCQTDSTRTLAAGSLSSVAVNTANGSTYLGWYDPTEVLVTDSNDHLAAVVPIPTVPTHDIVALAFWPNSNEVYGVTSPGDLAFAIDAAVDSVVGTVNYAAYLPRQMVHNPAGNKLYLLCTGHDEVLILDSTFGTPKHIPGGVYGTYAQPVLNPALNRLYVADYGTLRIIDCNADSLVRTLAMAAIDRPRPVMVPYLNKMYIFDGSDADSVYAYDCLRDTAIPLFELDDHVPCAVYDPRSNRVFFACGDKPTVRALDPVGDSVVKTFDLVGGSYRGKMTLNLDLGLLYYIDQSPTMMFTIDVLGDSVISSEILPWIVDAMFLNRRLGKLYMCGSSQTLVFDCALGAIVDTIDAGFTYSGLMDDRNDKLYLRYGAVVDCRYDSVVTRLDPINSRSMAWDAIDNRVFKATTSRLYVYRDDPYSIEEQKPGVLGPMLSVLGNPARSGVKVRLQIPPGQTGSLTVHDVAGRLIRLLSVARSATLNVDLKSVPAGVYFVSLEVGRNRTKDKVIVQH
ncbi:T9SS type A sorting domain-containing protein [candidate division WOR-3 bacterium]|uniref:T9SS type A sorting domain-containing protein n=1 Tax=candidate division WOR-3 bacterium TaxID=2052148 RepID=A0A937XEP0_UNCW3|nr:T9SS type A sorting domain-containing protein [candidate division WOR-3 bacterium]